MPQQYLRINPVCSSLEDCYKKPELGVIAQVTVTECGYF